MPQMSALLWFNLFFMFIFGYLIFSALNFFLGPPLKPPLMNFSPQSSEKPWKW
uniref:ATP synthase F0 subunit 8 n=1 Tax=Ombrastacoides huonensis TaxID=217112 RepID=A0A411ATM8_9EUCA|nr:ATP synthase F0 subunit 8 [Ombrastacoides huonensis]QAX91376.1 ATP synthase F0 subunit 8 [Ombrastacoides huonensis]